MSLLLLVRFTATAAAADRVAELLSAGRDRGVDAPGCQQLTLCRDESQPTQFALVELWDSAAAHSANREHVVAHPDHAELLGLLEGRPVTDRLTVLT